MSNLQKRDKNYLKKYLLKEIEESKVTLDKNFSDESTLDDDILKENALVADFYNIDFFIELLEDTEIDTLFYIKETYELKPIVIIEFLYTLSKLNFFIKSGFSENKSRFDDQVTSLRVNVDYIQRFSEERINIKTPQLPSVILYDFRQYLTRYNFCSEDAIKALIGIYYKNKQRLPKESNEFKKLHSKRIEKYLNCHTEISNKYKYLDREKGILKESLSDKEIESYQKEIQECLKNSTKYTAKKL